MLIVERICESVHTCHEQVINTTSFTLKSLQGQIKAYNVLTVYGKRFCAELHIACLLFGTNESTDTKIHMVYTRLAVT